MCGFIDDMQSVFLMSELLHGMVDSGGTFRVLERLQRRGLDFEAQAPAIPL